MGNFPTVNCGEITGLKIIHKKWNKNKEYPGKGLFKPSVYHGLICLVPAAGSFFFPFVSDFSHQAV